MKILGVIPARSGSKGVPRKNIRNIGGKPLIAYIIESARQVLGIDELIVSTDSEEIATIAEGLGVRVPFLRPPECADDNATLIDVSKHALNFYDIHFFKPTAVISLQPTSPLLTSESITRAIELFRKNLMDSVVSLGEIKHCHPFRAYKIEHEFAKPLTEYTTEKYLQKQDRPQAYGFSGGIYLRKRELLEAWEGNGFAMGDRVGGVTVSEEEALDIDSELDLLVFQTILKHRKKNQINKQNGTYTKYIG